MFAVPPSSAIQDFQALYERYYGVVLPVEEAEIKLGALLGLLAAVRTRASACGAAHAGAAQDCTAVRRRQVCRSNGTPTHFSKTDGK